MTEPSYFHLCKTMFGQPSASIWPVPVTIEPFNPALAPFAHALLRAAYAQGGGRVTEFSHWYDNLITDAEYDAQLVFCVMDSSRHMIAFAQCWSSGFIKDLAVCRTLRRQGLGEALLLHVLGVFYSRQQHRICLKVERDNPSGAVQLYRRLGFEAISATNH